MADSFSPEYTFEFKTTDLNFAEVQMLANALGIRNAGRMVEYWAAFAALAQRRLVDEEDTGRLMTVPWGHFNDVAVQFDQSLRRSDQLRQLAQQVESDPEVVSTAHEE